MKNKKTIILPLMTFIINILFMIAGYVVVPDGSALLYVLCLIIVLNGTFGGILIYKTIENGKEEALQETISDLNMLNDTLRAQKHDCLNHIQVMYGLIELDEYEEAKKYIKPVYGEVERIKNTVKTSEPTVNALIQAEYNLAKKEGVDFIINVDAMLDMAPLEPWELCKLIRSAVNGCKVGTKNIIKIEFSLSEKEDELSLRAIAYGNCDKKIKQHDNLSLINSLIQGIGGNVKDEVTDNEHEIKVTMKQK